MSDAVASSYREIFYGMFYPASLRTVESPTTVSDVAYRGALGAVRKALQEDDQKNQGAGYGAG